MKFSLEIEMDNAAFGDDAFDQTAEVKRILKRLIVGLPENGGLDIGDGTRNLRDINGNTVGRWEVSA